MTPKLTDEEKDLILLALSQLFRTGVKGEMAAVEAMLILARSIERKLTAQVQERDVAEGE